jgi:hypothetical protein
LKRLAVAAFFATATASADDPKPAWRAGSDLIKSVPNAAWLDGVWSLTNQSNTLIVDRGWSAPTVQGLTGHFTRRILYGTTWTVMLGAESVAVVSALGTDFEWLGAARYRLDWMLPLDLPACSHVGSNAGCGLGTGGFAFLQLRPKDSRWWFEAGGGSTDQRVLFDPLRTTGESTWVLTPIAALREFEVPHLRALLGGGVYGGMHNASMHPSLRGESVYPNGPWTELYPLEGGIGPGGYAELSLTVRPIVVEGDLTVAPFLLSSVDHRPANAVAPLDHPRSGLPIWRKLDVGIGYRLDALTMSAVAFAQELSGRPVIRAGSRGTLIRFDIPLR